MILLEYSHLRGLVFHLPVRRSLQPSSRQRRLLAIGAVAAVLAGGISVASAATTSRPQTLDDQSDKIVYQGYGWNSVFTPGSYRGSEHSTDRAGHGALITVDGSSVKIYGTTGPDRGGAMFYAGPTPVGFFEMYSPAFKHNVLLYSGEVTPGTVLAMRATGGRVPASTSAIISIDKVTVNGRTTPAKPGVTVVKPTPTAPTSTAPTSGGPTTTAPTPTPTTVKPAPTVTVPAPTPTTQVAPVVVPSGKSINVLDFGAKGDGTSDDTVALQTALDATTSGVTLVIPAGKTFVQTKTLTVKNDGAHIVGPGTLLATNDRDSSFWIKGNNVTVDGNLTFKSNSKTRGGAWEHYRVVLWSSGTTLRNITVDGSHAAGIFMQGASNYLIDTVLVENTMADGIHNTAGSHDGVIRNATVRNVGDDGIAVVSYKPDGPVVKNITVEGAKIYRPSAPGRSLSVVGGENITFKDFYIEESSAASIYVSAEKEWNTNSVNNVKFINGTIKNANWYAKNDHGAILLYNSQAGGIISNVSFDNIKIENTRENAGWNMAILDWGKGTSGVTFNNISISGKPNPFKLDGNPAAGYALKGITLNGAPWTQP